MILGRRGHARRHHEPYVGGNAAHVVQHESYALFAAHVGDLVRVGVVSRHALGHGYFQILARPHHDRFEMQVRVVERRHDVSARAVDFRDARVAAHAGELIAAHRDVPLDEAAAEHVDDGRVLYDDVRLFPSGRDVYDSLSVHLFLRSRAQSAARIMFCVPY